MSITGVRVLFLGRLRDLAGGDERALDAPLGWPDLLDAMPPGLAHELQCARIHVAHNGQVLADKTALMANAGDEVALLPPVSGG